MHLKWQVHFCDKIRRTYLTHIFLIRKCEIPDSSHFLLQFKSEYVQSRVDGLNVAEEKPQTADTL